MLRCPTKTFFGYLLRDLVKTGNILTSDGDIFYWFFRFGTRILS